MNTEEITKVLALFDKEDIPYIKATKFLEFINGKEINAMPKVKKIGGKK